MAVPYPFRPASTNISPVVFIAPTLTYMVALALVAHAPHFNEVVMHLASLEKLWNVFSIILGLLFGFYTSVSFSRWWSMRTHTAHAAGRAVDITVILAGEGLTHQADLFRLLLLAYAIHLIELSGSRGDDRIDALKELGLLKTSDEIPQPLTVPAVYCAFLRRFTAIQGIPDHVRLSVQEDLTVCRAAAGDAMMYVTTPMPPTLSWIVHGGTWAFLLFMPFGYVAPLAGHDTQAVMVISSLIFIIMHTWLVTTDYILNSTRGFDLNKYWLNTVAAITSLAGECVITTTQQETADPPQRRSARRRVQQKMAE
ncbi:hypothetical protein FOL47_008760 [Perkinsus chesapeaki]|uniref:Uncharacterized protein n=1 Tax=Perkinsus chesapeaki TaxID=330153 RepID=A0A7J6LC51_PERCH|nr:hypothetical protein FOL47_008760 [Perkinsus chesapeaki]